MAVIRAIQIYASEAVIPDQKQLGIGSWALLAACIVISHMETFTGLPLIEYSDVAEDQARARALHEAHSTTIWTGGLKASVENRPNVIRALKHYASTEFNEDLAGPPPCEGPPENAGAANNDNSSDNSEEDHDADSESDEESEDGNAVRDFTYWMHPDRSPFKRLRP